MFPLDRLSEDEAGALVHTLNFFTAVMLEHGGVLTVKPESLVRATQLNATGDYQLTFNPDGTTGTITIPHA